MLSFFSYEGTIFSLSNTFYVLSQRQPTTWTASLTTLPNQPRDTSLSSRRPKMLMCLPVVVCNTLHLLLELHFWVNCTFWSSFIAVFFCFLRKILNFTPLYLETMAPLMVLLLFVNLCVHAHSANRQVVSWCSVIDPTTATPPHDSIQSTRSMAFKLTVLSVVGCNCI